MRDHLTTTQAAAELGISPRRVRSLLQAGRLAGEMVAGVWLVTRASVEKWRPLPQGWQKGRRRK